MTPLMKPEAVEIGGECPFTGGAYQVMRVIATASELAARDGHDRWCALFARDQTSTGPTYPVNDVRRLLREDITDRVVELDYDDVVQGLLGSEDEGAEGLGVFLWRRLVESRARGRWHTLAELPRPRPKDSRKRFWALPPGPSLRRRRGYAVRAETGDLGPPWLTSVISADGRTELWIVPVEGAIKVMARGDDAAEAVAALLSALPTDLGARVHLRRGASIWLGPRSRALRDAIDGHFLSTDFRPGSP